MKLRSPQQPLGPGVVLVGVVVGGAGLVGPGEGVGPPPMPGREATHHRVLDLVLPSSYPLSCRASLHSVFKNLC